MGFQCTVVRERVETIEEAYCVIGSFAELQKGTMVIRVPVWASKADYLKARQPLMDVRLVATAEDVASDVNIRTGIYNWLMQQPEFVNPVADLNDDFPVTPIG